MDISNNLNDINKLTLECLVSKSHYDKLIDKKLENKIDNKKIKFYKKRILSSTKDFFKGKSLNNNIDKIFNEYCHTLIQYFENLDTNDILQKDYESIDNSILKEYTEMEENPDELLFKEAPIKTLTLNNFVKKNKSKEKIFVPERKDINLKDPILKRKGLKKKKNENV